MCHRAVLSAPTLALLAGSPALAGLSQSVIVAPGGYLQAGAYSQTIGGLSPGFDITQFNGLGQDFHELAFAGNASVTQSASFSGSGINNGATGSARMGIIGMSAHNTSPDASSFAAGVVNGGWKETFTVTHPTLAGQAGFLVFEIRARGTMHVEGLTGSAYLKTGGFKDNVELAENQYFNRGTAGSPAPGLQEAMWGVASFGFPDNLAVDGTVTMSVPITFGQPFTLGIYAIAVTSQRSSGGVGGSSTATLSFDGDGVVWNGITAVYNAGAPVSGYGVVSGTATNWSVPQGGCYANCDGSTAAPVLNVLDFSCFLNKFAAADPYANCDGSTTPPTLNVLDFSCYLNRFAAGCT